MSERNPIIVFAIFPGVTQLDFTGPHQVFIALPGGEVMLASGAGSTIEAGGGMTFTGVRRLADIEECDVVCVPGGRGATDNAMHDQVFLAELRRLAAGARYVTSVCTGALVLGAAGLLRGKRATTIGLGTSSWRCSGQSRNGGAWYETATSSPAAASPRGSISR